VSLKAGNILQQKFWYDHAGRRVKKEDRPPGATAHGYYCLWSGDQVVVEYQTLVGTTFTPGTQPEPAAASDTPSDLRYMHWGLLSVRLVTDGNGNQVDTQSHDAYGGEIDGGGEVPPFFTTYEQELTALDYARARYYRSNHRRFTSPDSYRGSYRSGSPQSLNRYAYVANDPINRTDPTGLCQVNPDGTMVDCGVLDTMDVWGSDGGGGGSTGGGGIFGDNGAFIPEEGAGNEGQGTPGLGGDPRPITLFLDAGRAVEAFQGECANFINGLIGGVLNSTGRGQYFWDFLTRYNSILYTLYSGQWGNHVIFSDSDSPNAVFTNTQWHPTRSGISTGWTMTFYSNYFSSPDNWRVALILHEALHALGSGFVDDEVFVSNAGLTCRKNSDGTPAETASECIQRHIVEGCNLRP
jgi:RHS repeat-associated protein